MTYQTILYETDDDHVATITLNRPKAMNTFNKTMVEEFSDVWVKIREDDSIHAVLLKASDGRAFSVGIDVRNPGEGFWPDNIWSQIDPGHYLSPKQNKVWKPIVVAVHGMCAAGAFYWLNEADIIVCSEDAEFFDPHVTYGLVAALEPIGLRQRIALGDVLRMALLGNDERISAQTALRMGLVSEITQRGDLEHRGHELAAAIASKPPAAIQGTVRAIWDSLDVLRTAGLDMALKYCQLGNPLGTAQVDRDTIMSAQKGYKLR